jgi:two-component system, response regulator PdtaR
VLRVLVAEDEAVIRLDLVEMLNDCGFEVVEAVADGESALHAIGALAPDVALLDIAMPGLDGIEVARRVADQVAVVMLTAFGQRDLVEQATAAGAMGYLVKPIGSSNLMPAIEIAAARWATAHAALQSADQLRQKLEDRKDVDRAKGILMGTGLSEADAFAHLRQRAMDGRTTLGDMARVILAAETGGEAFR